MTAPSSEKANTPLATILKAALLLVGVAGIAGWLILAVVHLDDRYRLGHVQGHWMALAQYANEGTIYPPLYDGERFGGTRHMPLPILVNAAASRITGEYLRSGKAMALGLFATLLLIVMITLRQMGCPWPMTIALCGLLPATNTGVLVGSTPGGDVPAVVLQALALLVVTSSLRRQTLGWLVAGGAVAGLAAASKLTGGWAALAVISWLACRRDWRKLAWFTSAWAATSVLTLGAVQWISEGRFFATLLPLTLAGGRGEVGWIRAPNQLSFFGAGDAPAVWMVAPFAILGTLAAWRASALTVYHHALGWSLVATMIVFTDIGAGLNQLLDPAVLTIIAVGHLTARLPEDRLGAVTLATAATLTVVWAGLTGVRGFVPDLRGAWATVRSGEPLPQYHSRPLASLVTAGETLLAEDPGLPVLLGQTPIVLDAFMLRRLDQVRPRMVDTLVARIERREFDRVALIIPLAENDSWWRDYHFGLRVVGALRKNYAFVGEVGGYYLYQPNRS